MIRKYLIWALSILLVAIAAATVYLGPKDKPKSNLTSSQPDQDTALDKPDPAPVPSVAETNTVVTAKPATKQISGPDKAVLTALEDIKTLMGSLDDRITGLERDMDGLRLEQSAHGDTSSQEDMTATEEPDIDGTPQQALEHQKIENYYASVDQITTQNTDPILSSVISGTYEQMINSREEWATHASLKTVQCGAEFCKVVVNYRNDMDPDAMFAFEPSMYMVNTEYPTSTGRLTFNPDGTTDMIMYFAKSQDKLPALPN